MRRAPEVGVVAPDIALTGVPRSGTTLACRLFADAPDTIALAEPLDVTDMPREQEQAIVWVAQGFASLRARIAGEGRAPSRLVAGQATDNFVAPPGRDGARRLLASLGDLDTGVPAPGYTLVVKHNAAFAALLPRLAEEVPVVGIVRDPRDVLASWRSVPLPVGTGRLPAGERLDPSLASRLHAESSCDVRQLVILDWFFARLARLPRSRVVRYEDLVATGGRALMRAVGTPEMALPHHALRAERARGALPPSLAAQLRAWPGAWRLWYPESGT